MDLIKKGDPFVDLLKPETEAVIPILLALEPTLRANLPALQRALRVLTGAVTLLALGMYHGTVVPGFPQHPHRGFETVTITASAIVLPERRAFLVVKRTRIPLLSCTSSVPSVNRWNRRQEGEQHSHALFADPTAADGI